MHKSKQQLVNTKKKTLKLEFEHFLLEQIQIRFIICYVSDNLENIFSNTSQVFDWHIFNDEGGIGGSPITQFSIRPNTLSNIIKQNKKFRVSNRKQATLP